jgi:hypothetical protein
MRISLLGIIYFISSFVYGQSYEDSLYTIYKKRLIISLETGFNSSPLSFDLKYGDVKKISFVPNPPWIIKPSISYYGVTLGIGFKLPANLLSTSKYTKTSYFDVALNFAIKKRVYFGLDFQYYKGFTLVNQGDFDTSGVLRSNNGMYPDLNTVEAGINVRYFFSKKFNYKAALGIQGDYKKSVFSPYIYGYLGGYGVGNNNFPVFPNALQDNSASNSKARNISSFEFGVIPGVAGVLRKGWFQGNMIFGFGPMIQGKSYAAAEASRGFLGLDLRTDMQLSLGVQKDKWFLLLNSDFKFRTIKIAPVTFNQYYYDIRLVAGYRIQVKTPKGILKMEKKKAAKRAEKAAKKN